MPNFKRKNCLINNCSVINFIENIYISIYSKAYATGRVLAEGSKRRAEVYTMSEKYTEKHRNDLVYFRIVDIREMA
jgi:hypothetical protein